MNMPKQKVLVSIDTEGPVGAEPVQALIFGKTESGEEYGIRYLMDLFDKYGAKGLFFVDFAEAWDYGAKKIEEVVQCIKERGHDIGVHLHPDHMADKERRYLWQYSYAEQFEMISKCTELYVKMVGKKPLSFRAGRYGANNDTIRILEELGYKYDMSEFFGNKYCKINPPICCNRVTRINNSKVVEVPVTSFQSFKSPLYSRFDKIDCAMDFNEYKRVMRSVGSAGTVDVVSLFVHSFSVLDWRKSPDSPMFSKKRNKGLVNQLEWVVNNANAMFVSESELEGIEAVYKTTDSILDVSQGVVSYWFFIKRVISVLKDRMTLNV